MHAVDLTYPLYPIVCFVAIIMLFLVLLTSFVRQRWNFGVASLCFWLLLELLSLAINSIIWSDNADIKLYVYCDIGGSDHVYAACCQGGHDLTKHVSFACRDDSFRRQAYGHAHPLSQTMLDSKSQVCGATQQSTGEYNAPLCAHFPS